MTAIEGKTVPAMGFGHSTATPLLVIAGSKVVYMKGNSDHLHHAIHTGILALWLLPTRTFGSPSTDTSCDRLPDLVNAALGTIVTASIPANSLNASGTFNSVAFCRANGSVPYPEDNTVFFEVWLPEADSYNDRGSWQSTYRQGKRGMAGRIDYAAMVENVNKGFATAGGDAGRRASDNNGGDAHPGGVHLPCLHDRNQVLAWIRDSVALFTPPAKGITDTYYHEGPAFLPQESLDHIRNAALDECDLLDGVEDRVLENPLTCDFDLDGLACEDLTSNTSTCLTPRQLAAAKEIYAGPRHSKANASLYPGFDLGSKSEWMVQQGRLSLSFSLPLLQNMVFDNLSYEGTAFDWAADVDASDEKVGSLIDAIGPNLTSFKKNGGKLLVTQGWADPFNVATWPIDHLDEVSRATGGERQDWLSLFMIPGGGHCGGAATYPWVPSKHNSLEALVDWVENGQAPAYLLGVDPADGSKTTGKICTWPRTAKYIGVDADEPDVCVCSD
ncbi:putative esterase [Colletotrichum shisoi]|uniref:Carboxylic ester hydrolase n=1 Tax=Colletotrichum shisoi TaxID=2078593 RepID=A0A5Q4BC34_9PEZI|nr:putative esterase [Colletotrichum shisoi]